MVTTCLLSACKRRTEVQERLTG